LLKQRQCPHCGCAETLNRHSNLYGNDPVSPDGRSVRGQRAWCSNRGQRGGCGRSFPLFIADFLPRHTVRASWLWQWLVKRLAGLSLQAATQAAKVPFALETFYRLDHKLRYGLEGLRTALCGLSKPPDSSHAAPLLQTVEHLKQAFPESPCPVADFQVYFQQSLLG